MEIFQGRQSFEEKMHQHHIYTGQDLYNKDEFELIRLFGKEDEVCIIKLEV